MSIIFACPLCGHQISVDKGMAGQRTPCAMCGFKVEVPKAPAQTPPPKTTPAPAPVPVEPPPESVPPRRRKRAQKSTWVVVLLGILLCLFLAWYGTLNAPVIYRMLPGTQAPPPTTGPQPQPGGPLSPADFDKAL